MIKEFIWRFFFIPWLFLFDPERIHNWILTLARKSRRNKIPYLKKNSALRNRRFRRIYEPYGIPDLRVDFNKFKWPGPLGLAAGLDKNGLAPLFWASLGFFAVEIGTLTPKAQDGNLLPRLFRLPSDKAIINRMGFNNSGLEVAESNLRYLSQMSEAGQFFSLGINLGKNKEVNLEDAHLDYIQGAQKFANLADYITVNISSPNTLNLRRLHERKFLEKLLSHINKTKLTEKIPFFLKLAPDFQTDILLESVHIALQNKFVGIIMGNTTIQRPASLVSKPDLLSEVGGLSGAPLKEINLKKVAEIHKAFPDLPIIGAGGIFSFQEMKEYLVQGARAVQVYTGLIYQGPNLAQNIINDLLLDMKRFKSTKYMDYLSLIRKNH